MHYYITMNVPYKCKNDKQISRHWDKIMEIYDGITFKNSVKLCVYIKHLHMTDHRNRLGVYICCNNIFGYSESILLSDQYPDLNITYDVLLNIVNQQIDNACMRVHKP